MILANHVPLSEWEDGDYNIGANQAGNCACCLLNCISVTDDSETNEQNKPIATGLLYMHTPNLTRFQHSYVEKCGFLTRWVNDCCIHGTEKVYRSQRSIFTQRNGGGSSVRNLKGKDSTVAKMCC